jgi:hypothetical protein
VALEQLVKRLAPHVALEIAILEATSVRQESVPDTEGVVHVLPFHPPSRPDTNTLLITHDTIEGREGWGRGGSCVVNVEKLNGRADAGGDVADILIHEWLHTIHDEPINGRPVPWADNAEHKGFTPEIGADGWKTWHRWYRYALGDLSVTPP